MYDYDYKAFFTNQSSGETHKEILGLDNYRLKSAKAVYAVNHTGSGKNEILIFGSSGYNIYSIDPLPASTGYSYTANLLKYGGEITFSNYKRILTGDFNGDGKTDIIGIGDTKTADIFYSTGSGFAKGNFELDDVPFFDRQFNTIDILLAADFNGDGITDLLHGYNKTFRSYGITQSIPTQNVYYFKGVNHNRAEVPVSTIQDICEDELNYYYSTYPDLQIINSTMQGDRCIDPWNNQPMMEYTVEFNFSTQVIERYHPILTRNTSYFGELVWIIYGSPPQVGDFDGDGKADIIQSKGASAYVLGRISGANNSGLLQYVQDNYGNFMSIEYESLARKGTDVYTKTQTSLYPLLIANLASKVVKSVKTPNGVGGVNTTSYQYKDATLSRIKGFLGFQETTVSDNLGNSRVSSAELNTPFQILIPKKTKVFVQSNLVSENTLEYSLSLRTLSTTRYYTNKGIKSLVTKTTNQDVLKGITIITNISNYDAYNNPQKEVTDYGQGIQTEVTRTFFNSASAGLYRIGLPLTETVKNTRGGNQFITSKQITYSPGKYLPIKQEEFVNGSKARETQWTYDIKGNVVNVTNSPFTSGASLTTVYEYEGSGKYVIKETDPMGFYKSYAAFNSFGKPATITDHRGNVTNLIYDVWDRVVSVQNPDGTTDNTTIAWASNNPAGAKVVVTESGPGKPTKKTYTDALGREIRTSVQRFDNQELRIDKVYDANGRLQKVSLPTTGTPSLWNTYTYDTYSRPITVLAANSNTVSYSYAGNSVTETKNGIASTKQFDAIGNVTSITDAGGTITYALRPDGQPSAVVAPGDITTSFEYDSYGRRTKIIDPSAGTKTFAYDGWGNTNKETDANGKVINTTFDQYGRIISRTTPDIATTFTYNANGLLESETSDNGTGTNITYDGVGRTLTYKETGADNKWLQKAFTYSNGNVSTIAYSTQSGAITTETNNWQNGYLKKITITNGQVIFDLQQENSLGKPTKIISGPITRNYSYDQYGMPTGRSAQTSAAGTYMNFEYNFNATTGNLNYRKDVMRSQTENFSYDNLNRLTGFGGHTISYDNKGNITQKSGIGNYHYLNSAKPYALTGIVQSGNVIPERQQQISYASFSRPLTITEDGYTAQFIYEADGDRVKMHVTKDGTLVLNRHYLANQYELDEKPGSTREKLYLGGDYYSAGAVLVRENGGAWQVFYINSDYLGSITHLVNSAGNVVAEYSFDAWGRLRNPVTHAVYGDGQQPELFLGRGYTGHEHLNWFGLINMNARVYDPVHGRFLAPDPYVQAPDFTQSFNRFGYAWGNPLIYTDPDGEFFWLLIPIVIGAGFNIYDNWSGIQSAFKEGIWQGIGSTLGYAAVGAAQGVVATYLAPVSPMLSGAATNVIGSVGNGFISGQTPEQIMIETTEGIFMGIATGGFSGALGGTFNKAGKWVANKISNKISSNVIGTVIESYVSNFGSQLTKNMAVDALDGGDFNLGDNLLRSGKTAIINSAIDGAAIAAIELKERQLTRKAAASTRVVTEPVGTSYNLPEIGTANTPIRNIPDFQLRPQSGIAPSSQLQKNINTINRLRARASTRSRSIIIKGADGKITVINIP